MVRQRLGDERGIAVVAVLAVLVVISILAAPLATVSIQSSHDSNRDRNSIRALEAAQAGLALANYRINALHPGDTQCVTDVVSSPNVGADCTFSESVGNGASYIYYVSQRIAAGAGCGSLPGSPTDGTQRCITVTGTVGGSVRRIQARVAALPGTPPLLPVHGLLGLDYVSAKNNMDFAAADLGSNRLIRPRQQRHVRLRAARAGRDLRVRGRFVSRRRPQPDGIHAADAADRGDGVGERQRRPERGRRIHGGQPLADHDPRSHA